MPHLGHLLEKAEDSSDDMQAAHGSPGLDEMDTQHHELWSEAREKHQQRTQELAAYRRESLSTSHRARIALLEEQLKQASDEKLQRMRRSQIEAAEADYTRRIQDLDSAMERADVVAELVAYGTLVLKDRIRWMNS